MMPDMGDSVTLSELPLETVNLSVCECLCMLGYKYVHVHA